MHITVDLSDEQAAHLRSLAEELRVQPNDLVRAACLDLLSKPARDFQDVADYVLGKNQELYKRLA
jgi:antitoxin FitA